MSLQVHTVRKPLSAGQRAGTYILESVYHTLNSLQLGILARVRRDYLRICYLFLSVANQHIIRFWILPELGLFGEFSRSVHNLYDSVVNSCIGRFLRIISSH